MIIFIIFVKKTDCFFHSSHTFGTQVLDGEVFPQNNSGDASDQFVDANGLIEGDNACILYCERFMEFLIDLLSQLPTRRYTQIL